MCDATAAYSNENPFASTHSLDANPFDDPEAQQEAERQARLQELSARERDLERRELMMSPQADLRADQLSRQECLKP